MQHQRKNWRLLQKNFRAYLDLPNFIEKRDAYVQPNFEI